ncbi:MAG: LURP-one-related/scramblase family protein [Oscillospiraceae bacterium]
MKLLFKQRMFSWFDSYDIYDEGGNTAFTVKGRLSWGHCLEIFDSQGAHVGTVKEEVLTFLPRFALYAFGNYIGEIKKEFTFFKPVFTLNCNDWTVEGDWMQWDYQVRTSAGELIMQASKELFNWTDTYVIDVVRPEDALLSLMIVLAIDAAKCSSGN